MPSPGSFERQERFTRVLTYVLAVVFYAASFSLAWFVYGPVIGFVVCAPVLGAYGSWLLVSHGASMGHWLRWLALRKVNGSYRAFDDVAVRILWSDGQCRVS